MTHEAPERTGTQVPSRIRAVPVRHPGRWVAAAVLLLLIAMAVHATVFARVQRGKARQDRFGWQVVGDYFLSKQVLDGLAVTLELTAIAMAIGIAGGVLLAVMRLSQNPIVRWVSWAYIWFFRGTPVLVQLLFWFSLSYVFPTLSLGVPFGPEWVHINANDITPFILAFVGLGLNEAAYMSEIVRAGIISVDEGQAEAAQALGMTRLRTMRRIVLPQAMRVIIPPTGNETISMLKTTSLVVAIGYFELMVAVQTIYSQNYKTVPLLITAAAWYLFMTSVLTLVQIQIEKRFARGTSRDVEQRSRWRLRMFSRGGGNVT